MDRPGNKGRLLFVDDEVPILNSMKALFRHEYDVAVATGGREALQIIREHAPHVIVCDQRMPQMQGVDLLRMVKKISPETMRILLTGYADRDAVIGSINKGEVFRFVNKPWDNNELYNIVSQAAGIARQQINASASSTAPVNDDAHAVREASVLVIEDDPAIREMLKSILTRRYKVHLAGDLKSALGILQTTEVGVVVSEMTIGSMDITGLIKALKRHHPNIVTIVMTSRTDAMAVIDLINQGQIFRFLTKPVKPGICLLTMQASMERYRRYRANPALTTRVQVEETTESNVLSASLLERIKSLRKFFLRSSRQL